MIMNIRMITDDNNEIYFSKTDLTKVFNERMSKFRGQIKGFRAQKQSKIESITGAPNMIDATQEELDEAFRFEGMSVMLQGIMDMLDIQNVLNVNKK